MADDPIILSHDACRAMNGTTVCTAIAQQAGFAITGQVAPRLLYAQSNTDTAFLDRSQDPTASLLPLQNVTLKIFEAKQNIDKDKPLATTQSDATGNFQFASTLLKIGIEYKLLAIYKNKTAHLKEEQVLIEKIKVDKMPDPDTTQTLSLTHKNQPLKGEKYIRDETENISVTLTRTGTNYPILDFSGKAVLAFATCLLSVPYINQNHQSDGTPKAVNINKFGSVTGAILCFPTSVAMLLSYYGLSPSTTEDVAQKNYDFWELEQFPNRVGTDGVNNYKFKNYNPKSDSYVISNVWEWWWWEHRVVRNAASLPIKTVWSDWPTEREGTDDFPADGAYVSNWISGNISDAALAPHLRRQIGRGWPCVLGTNLTSAGHIVVLVGLILKVDGSIHKFFFNNPWGDDGDKDAQGYYDSNTVAYNTKNKLTTIFHMELRLGMKLPDVASHLVLGA